MTFSNSKFSELRARSVLKVVDNFYVGLAETYRRLPIAHPALYGLTIDKNIPYLSSSLREHQLDIIRPKNIQGPLPVLFYIHGGAFRILSKNTHILFAMMFAKKGFVVVNINYRLAPAHPFPAAMEDTCEAYKWTLNNIANYGGDINNIIVSGDSAGANLSTALAIASCTKLPENYAKEIFNLNAVPKAVIPACGYLEITRPERFNTGGLKGDVTENIMNIYLNDYVPQSHLRGPLNNPLPFLESTSPTARPLPPFFIPIGGADSLLPESRRLQAALHNRNVHAQLEVYPKQGHVFHAFLWKHQARQCWRDIFSFTDRMLYSNQPRQKSEALNIASKNAPLTHRQ